jgi:RNA-binding protein 26
LFKTRAGAEQVSFIIYLQAYNASRPVQGLAKGQNISTVGHVQLSWYTGKPNISTSPIASGKSAQGGTAVDHEQGRDVQEGQTQNPDVEVDAEEETVARGWGGDDDGDGMGML